MSYNLSHLSFLFTLSLSHTHTHTHTQTSMERASKAAGGGDAVKATVEGVGGTPAYDAVGGEMRRGSALWRMQSGRCGEGDGRRRGRRTTKGEQWRKA